MLELGTASWGRDSVRDKCGYVNVGISSYGRTLNASGPLEVNRIMKETGKLGISFWLTVISSVNSKRSHRGPNNGMIRRQNRRRFIISVVKFTLGLAKTLNLTLPQSSHAAQSQTMPPDLSNIFQEGMEVLLRSELGSAHNRYPSTCLPAPGVRVCARALARMANHIGCPRIGLSRLKPYSPQEPHGTHGCKPTLARVHLIDLTCEVPVFFSAIGNDGDNIGDIIRRIFGPYRMYGSRENIKAPPNHQIPHYVDSGKSPVRVVSWKRTDFPVTSIKLSDEYCGVLYLYFTSIIILRILSIA
ncbi:hypothetical protein T265_04758 [Opisthorchis viverrini]|uniref:Uncharacterized protein n=1 Tax=Opisthorchis viverrini TaxID=6198 RepID=A0A074ZLX1_OPIVI|nr:hypothetical protein T265_04758 [Opisthorchis viverrini]KER28368.1 hypothetical protein T265_04758 [Opisthorchis viverrini]